MAAVPAPIATADLFDAHPDAVRVCELQMRNLGGRTAFHGRAVTLRVSDSHVAVREALSEPGEGCVLVVDVGGSLRVGVLGDRLGAIAVANGWAGVVVHGVVRDSVALAGLDIGVKALGTTARRNLDPTESAQGVPVTFGGITIAPGDWVYADADALLIAHERLDP